MAKLDGWLPPKTVRINAGAGGDLTNYQMLFMVYAGNGIDGVMYLPSGELVGKVYANNLCKAGFEDVRFSHHDNRTPYVQKIVEKVNGSHALVVVKVVESLAQNQLIDFHFGNPDAIDVSSDDVFSAAPISGVVAAYPLDEADQEVNPTISYAGAAGFWRAFGSGTGSYKSTVTDEASQAKAVITADGTYENAGFQHTYSPAIDVSAKSRVLLTYVGAGSGRQIRVFFGSGANNFYQFITDDVAGEKTVVLPFGSFTQYLTPNWNNITNAVLDWRSVNSPITVYVKRLVFDVGVPAADYSGNGNHGTATGTKIIPAPYSGQNARELAAGDLLNFGANVPRTNTGTWLIYCNIHPTTSMTLINHGRNGYNDQHALSVNSGGSLIGMLRVGNEPYPYSVFVSSAVGAVPFDQWVWLAFRQDGVNPALFVNGVKVAEQTSGVNRGLWNNALLNQYPFTVALHTGEQANFYGKVSKVFNLGVALTDQQIALLSSGLYPDVRLEPGKIMVRKWATIALPVVGEWFDATAAEQLGRPVRKRRDPLDDWERRPSFWSLSKLRDSLREIVKS